MTTETPILVRPFVPEEWELYRSLRLESLRAAPNAFGSTFEQEAGASTEDWKARFARGFAAAGGLSSSSLPLVAQLENEAVGLAWAKLDPECSAEAHLYQMWVRQPAAGHGCGSALLMAAINWARAQGATQMILRVTDADSPAKRLYLRHGFHPIGPLEPLRAGSTLTCQKMTLLLKTESG